MRKFNFGRRLYLLLWLCLLPVMGFAQQDVVTGQVVDDDGNPLIGVSVIVPAANRGVSTDLQGNFRITALPDEVIVFSYIGYEDVIRTGREVAALNRIVLSETATSIADVVVVGYGTQKKVSIVAAITQTSGEELLKVGNITSVSEALQGKLNRVIAVNKNGQPGSGDTDMYIRGKATWHSTSPLILVDGIERNMDDIDMNEIETISVLKDASATAVYGVRGANGVILITSKRGINQKPVISFTTNFGLKQPTANLKWADYITAQKTYNNALANDNNWGALIPQTTIAAWEHAYATGNYGPYNDVFPQVNWWDELAQTGFSQSYNVNIRGGSDFMRYFISLGYQNDGDIYNLEKQADFNPNHYYKRYNWRSNLDFHLTPTTTLSANMAGKMGYQNSTFAADPYLRILTAPTNMFPVKYSDGEWGDIEYVNPLANMNQNGVNYRKTFEGWYDLSLTQKLDFVTPGLQASARISYSSSSQNTDVIRNGGRLGNSNDAAYKTLVRYYRTYDYANPIHNADGTITYPLLSETRLPDDDAISIPTHVEYDRLDGYRRRLYYEFAVNCDRSFGDHNVTALALVNRQIDDQKDGNNIRFPSYREDWVGRVTYNWRERYLTEVNVSYTGSEKFARGNRFGLFPSASAGWRISEEPFIKGKEISRVLTNLKVRYSYGEVGYDGSVTGSDRWSYIQRISSGSELILGNTSQVTYSPLYWEGRIANLNSTWEKAVKQNLGVEIGLWNRMAVTVDLFDEKRRDILMEPKTLADWVAASVSEANLGKTKNHGFEIELHWNDRIGSSFNYWASFTMSASENRVVFRDDAPDDPDYLKAAGKPIGHQLRYIAIGNYGSIDDIFNGAQSNSINGWTQDRLVPGDLVYIDFDGDGILNGNDKVAVSQLNYPLTTYSFSFGFDWKGLGFSALLYAPTRVYRLVDSRYFWNFTRSQVMAQPDVSNRWDPNNPNRTGVVFPSLHLGDYNSSYNNTESTFRYRNYSYLRLKNVELSYKFPKSITDKISMSNLQVYVNGNNLFTFWNGDSRIDPETDSAATYPIVRTYTAGIRFSF